jgi:hypothetical protein
VSDSLQALRASAKLKVIVFELPSFSKPVSQPPRFPISCDVAVCGLK